jgi:hypothetical protein
LVVYLIAILSATDGAMALIVQGPTPAALRSAGPGRRIERWTGPVPPVRAFVLPVIVDEVMGQPRSPVRRSVITGGARRRRVASQDVPSIPLPSHFRRREKIEATARSSPMTGALRPGQGRRAASFHKWHAYRPLPTAFVGCSRFVTADITAFTDLCFALRNNPALPPVLMLSIH